MVGFVSCCGRPLKRMPANDYLPGHLRCASCGNVQLLQLLRRRAR
ncbi:MAG: hypothetical protein AABW54_00850 [Candidatus Micrarchaeota archaeon]